MTDKNENKRDRFKRIVSPRVSRALTAIDLIGRCAGAGYDYSEDDAARIVEALEERLRTLRKNLAPKEKTRGPVRFNLD